MTGEQALDPGTDHAMRVVGRGEIDAATCPRLAEALQEVVDRGGRLVVLDATDITFVDSSGLRVIVQAAAELEARGGRLLIEGMTPAVQRLFEITGLLERFRA